MATAPQRWKHKKILGDLHGFKNAFGGGEISREDVKNAANDQTKSPAERALAKRLDEKWGDISGNGKSINQKDIDTYRDKEQNHADMANAHAKDKDGKTLLDRVGDGKGGVSGEKLEQEMKRTDLTDKDKASLDRLNSARDNGYIYGKSGDLSKDQVAKLDQQAGLSPEEIKGKAKTGDPTSAEGQASAAALKDLTVKPGGGESLLDKVGDGKGGVDQAKVADFMAHPERHNLTPENQKTLKYLNDQIDQKSLGNTDINSGMPGPRENISKEDLAKAGKDAGVDLKPKNVAESPEQKTREQQFGHLFDKGKDGKSLYDNLKDDKGGISGDNLDKALTNPNLSDKDRASLSYLKSLQEDGRVYGKKDFTKEDLAEKAKEHNLNADRTHKGGLDTPPPRTDAPATVPAAGTEVKPETKAALTPPKHGGYYHVAEQMLSAAHKGEQNYEPSQKELKELVKQLQHANHNKKSLSQKEPLEIDEDIRKNPALAKLFA